MPVGARLDESGLRHYYGGACDVSKLATVSLWGQQVRVHRLVASHLVRTAQTAHKVLVAAGAWDRHPKRVDSYNCRQIRDTASPERHGTWSMHSRGLAFDLFMTGPGVEPPGGVWVPTDKLPVLLVEVFRLAGWTWGGTWARRDEPHFEWNTLPPVW